MRRTKNGLKKEQCRLPHSCGDWLNGKSRNLERDPRLHENLVCDKARVSKKQGKTIQEMGLRQPNIHSHKI